MITIAGTIYVALTISSTTNIYITSTICITYAVNSTRTIVIATAIYVASTVSTSRVRIAGAVNAAVARMGSIVGNPAIDNIVARILNLNLDHAVEVPSWCSHGRPKRS